MKCGTTSLYKYLNFHSDIHMSSNKEPGFFCDWCQRTEEWYESLYPNTVDTGQKLGEASTHYSKFPIYSNVPDNIHEYNPDIKIIYLVRHPVSRILSHYKYNRSKNKESKTLEECISLNKRNPYIAYSRYATQLKQYTRLFPRRQMLVVQSENLRHDRSNQIRSILSFIGVDPIVPANAKKEFNSSTGVTKRNRVADFVAQSSWIHTLYASIPSALRDKLKPLYRSNVPSPSLSEKQRAELLDYFKPEIEWLREYTGQQFDHWTN